MRAAEEASAVKKSSFREIAKQSATSIEKKDITTRAAKQPTASDSVSASAAAAKMVEVEKVVGKDMMAG